VALGVGSVRARVHGAAPYRVAVVHGGPGAPGSTAALARELSVERGVLEPFQSADSVDGQVAELARTLETSGSPPVVLIGHSWGAWLGVLVAASCPDLVRALVLVGSGPFEAEYARRIWPARMARLDDADRREAEELQRRLNEPGVAGAEALLARFGALTRGADAYDPLPRLGADDPLPAPHGDRAAQETIYRRVWAEASELRRTGGLLDAASRVRCPVVAVHGEHDPHPADGVRVPLTRVLSDFRFVLLPRCGHEPWTERHARDAFQAVLRETLDANDPEANRRTLNTR
jgi:pimeloyl-ACP methyl ester carboxylesterase